MAAKQSVYIQVAYISVAYIWLLFISGSLLVPVCRAHTAKGLAANRVTRWRASEQEHVNAPANASPVGQEHESGSLRETMDQVAAKNMWPMEKIG